MALNLNVFPYYDDAAAADLKNYNKILFKPGYAVQARELTQLQSTLQNQIQKFGDHVLKNGSVVAGCAEVLDTKYAYVKVKDTNFAGTTITKPLSSYVGDIIESASGSQAEILSVAEGSESDGLNLKTLYVKYIRGNATSASFFDLGEKLTVITSANSNSSDTFKVNDTYATTGSPFDSVGYGTVMSISDGIVYFDGRFIYFDKQTVTISKYAGNVTGSVGFELNESIVGHEADQTLLDPAQGSFNYLAPGADRLASQLELKFYRHDETPAANFANYVDILNGSVLRKKDVNNIYRDIGDMIANRTYEQAGNYSIISPKVQIKEHLNDGDNFGQFTLAQGGDNTKLWVGVEPGTVYVSGKRIKTETTTPIVINKGLATTTLSNIQLGFNYGNYVITNEVCGIWPVATGEKISLRDATQSAVSDTTYSANAVSGSERGTARVRHVELISGTPGSNTAQYKIYLYDIVMTSGTFETDVKSLYYNNTVKGFADIVLENSKAILKDSNQDNALIRFPARATKSLAPGGSYNNIFVYTKQIEGQLLTNGTITVSTSGIEQFIDGGAQANFKVVLEGDVTINSVLHKAGRMLDLSGITPALSNNNQTVTLDVGDASATTNVLVYATVSVSNLTPAAKTLVTSYVVIDTSTAGSAGTYNLGFADVYKILSIKMGASASSASSIESSSANVIDNFNLDTGQRDSIYAHGSIIKKQGSSLDLTNKKLVIKLQYFEHTLTTHNIFTVDSYPIDDTGVGVNTIETKDIPLYTSVKSGDVYDLRDTLDYRPKVANTASVQSSSPASATVNPVAATAFPASALGYTSPVVNTFFTTDVDYYLPRYDRVIVNDSGVFSVITGSSKINPTLPVEPDNSMSLATIYIPPYPSLGSVAARQSRRDDYAVKLTAIDNRRFTMRDVAALEKRIGRLEYYTSLSLLEKSTANMTIPDANGLDRFKNGILVDTFAGSNIGNVYNKFYHCATDPKNAQLRPFFHMENVDLALNSFDNLQRTGDLLTLPYNEITFARNDSFSRTRNCAEELIFDFNGDMVMDPPADNWMDTTNLPDLVLNIEGTADAWATMQDAWGTQWGVEQTLWQGDPVVTTGEIASGSTFTDGTTIYQEQYQTSTTSTTTTTTRTGTTLQAGISSIPESQQAGTRVVDTALIPYMRSIVVTFKASRLKPNTRIYPFFDGQKVAAHCRPLNSAVFGFTPSVTQEYSTDQYLIPGKTSWGSAIISDANGVVCGQFLIPANTFRVGTKVFRLCDDIENRAEFTTTWASYNFSSNGLSTIVQDTVVSTRQVQLSYSTSESNNTITQTNTVTNRLADAVVGIIPPPPEPPAPIIPDPVYGIYVNPGIVDEGDSVVANVTTANFGTGTLYWTIVGAGGAGIINSSDFTTPLSGEVAVSNNAGSITITTAADLSRNEGDEQFVIQLRTGSTSGPVVAQSNQVTIVDTSKLIDPTYSIAVNPGFVNEGSSVIATVSTTDYGTGTLYWTIEDALTNVAAASGDFTTGISGTVSVSGNSGSFTITTAADLLTEGAEQFVVRLRENSVTGTILATSNIVTINDTSVTPNPGYTIAVNPGIVNEGSSVTASVVTTSFGSGTLYWTIEGTNVTAGDISTGLSGSVVVTSNAGSFTITTSQDLTTEGDETFIVRLRTGSTSGPIVASSNLVTIKDTSLTPVPTYTITVDPGFVNEGASATANIATTNFGSGTLYWTIEGTSGTVNSADFSTGISGSTAISSNAGSFSISLTADQVTEGPEKFVVRLRTGSVSGPIVATSNEVSITDSSLDPVVTYNVAVNPGIITEGTGSATATVTTTNFSSGTLYWTIEGTNVTAGDVSPGLSGSVAITSNTGSFSLSALTDALVEGQESFIIRLRTGSTSGPIVATSNTVLINDATVVAPTYSISASPTTINEGSPSPSAVAVTVSTTNFTGTLYWTVSGAGITSGDLSALSGTVAISGNTGSFNISALADLLTEDVEVFTVQLRTGSTSGPIVATSQEVQINDTSRTPQPAYSISAAPSTINEGAAITANVDTQNVGTATLYWTVSGVGVNSGDLSAISGTVAVSGNTGTFNITSIADSLTEGTETFVIQLRTGSTAGPIVATSNTITINDTSVTPTYSISATPDSVDEGAGVTANISTVNVGNATLYWTISGTNVNSQDLSAVSGTVTLTNNVGSFNISTIADSITEGAESFVFQLRTGSVAGPIVATSNAVAIRDTSTTPVTYSISALPSTINEGQSTTLTVNTSGFGSGTLYWTTSGTAGVNDLAATSGSVSISGNAGTFTIQALGDALDDDNETFTVNLRSGSVSGPIVATSNVITIRSPALPPSYAIAALPGVVNEGESISLGISASNSDQSTLYWTISSASSATSADLSAASGSVSMSGTPIKSGSASTAVLADVLTEGDESVVFELRTGSTSGPVVATSGAVTITDTSVTILPDPPVLPVDPCALQTITIPEWEETITERVWVENPDFVGVEDLWWNDTMYTNIYPAKTTILQQAGTWETVTRTVVHPATTITWDPCPAVQPYRDPIAQTFFVQNSPNGMFMTSMDLRFATKSSSLGVTVEIREVVNGYPSTTVLPFASKFLLPSQVSVSEDGTALTNIKFPSPVYLKNNTEYCFVVLPQGNNTDYSLWVSELGQNQLNTTNRISEQPYIGVMFTAANNRTWTAWQAEDVSFRLNRASFVVNSEINPGRARFTPLPRDYLELTDYTEGYFNVNDTVSSFDITIISGGSNYTNGTVIGNVIGGGGYGAKVALTIENNSIVSAVVTNPGADYTSNPTGIQFAAGSGSGASFNIKLIQGTVAAFDDLYQVMTVVPSLALDSCFRNGNAIGTSSTKYATITNIQNKKVNSIRTNISSIVTPDTRITYTVAATETGATSPSTRLEAIEAENTHVFSTEREIFSTSNEFVNLNKANSFTAIATFSTLDEAVSPVIDTRQISMIAIANDINDDATNEDLRDGGNAASRYISRTVVLDEGQDAEDMLVYLTNVLPGGTDVKVYGKFANALDARPFENIPWVELETSGISATYANTPTEYSYRIPDANLNGNGIYEYTDGSATFTGYKTFAIKIVPLSVNTSIVPTIKELRAIALQV